MRTMAMTLCWPLAALIASACDPAAPDVDEQQQGILNGSPVNAEYSGHVYYDTRRGTQYITSCSGELVQNKWVLTARHCMEYPRSDGDNDFNDSPETHAQIWMYAQSRRSVRTYYPPKADADIVLLELDSPMQMPSPVANSFQRPLWSFDQALLDGPLVVFGYAGVPHNLMSGRTDLVSTGPHTISTDGSRYQQGIQGGDSGGGLYDMVRTPTLAGINTRGSQFSIQSVSVQYFRKWILGTIYPSSALVCHATECFTTMPSLPHNLSVQLSWEPCGSGAMLVQADVELEADRDFLRLTDALGTDDISGNAKVNRETQGRVLVSLRTDGSGTSRGLRSLRALCK